MAAVYLDGSRVVQLHMGSVGGATSELLISVFILVGVLFAVLLILRLENWVLHKRVGASLFLIYFAYVAFTYIYQAAE